MKTKIIINLFMFCLLACPVSIADSGNSFDDTTENWLQSNDSPQLRGLIDNETESENPEVGTPISDALPWVVFLSLLYMTVRTSKRVKN
jgi:hypothetical protein